MSYQPPNQPPVMPGPAYQPPPQGDWTPPKPKSRVVPILIGVIVVLVLAVAGLGFVLLGGTGQNPGATASQAPALTQAGAERACRTAFSKEFQHRQDAGATDDGIVVSVQGVDLVETFKSGEAYTVNGTIRFTLTTFPLDPVQDTLDLTCVASGSDEAPVTNVDNRN